MVLFYFEVNCCVVCAMYEVQVRLMFSSTFASKGWSVSISIIILLFQLNIIAIESLSVVYTVTSCDAF